MSNAEEQARNKLIKKAKSNFWIWLDDFWAETPEDRREIYMMLNGLRPGMKAALVVQWKGWVANESRHYVKRDVNKQLEENQK